MFVTFLANPFSHSMWIFFVSPWYMLSFIVYFLGIILSVALLIALLIICETFVR